MTKNDVWLVLWSDTQKQVHVETLKEFIAITNSGVGNSDYKIQAGFDDMEEANDYANLLADRHRQARAAFLSDTPHEQFDEDTI